MTLAMYQLFVQTALDANADLYRETHGAIEGKLIEPHRGQALQNALSLVRHLAQETLANGTEVEVPRADQVHLPTVVADMFGVSRSEVRRLMAYGGVRVDGSVIRDVDVELPVGAQVQLGTRREARYKPTEQHTHVLGERP